MPITVSLAFHRYVEKPAFALKARTWDRRPRIPNRQQRWTVEVCLGVAGGILLSAFCGWFVAFLIWCFVTPIFLIYHRIQLQKKAQLHGRWTLCD
jgi:hypothetical protein